MTLIHYFGISQGFGGREVSLNVPIFSLYSVLNLTFPKICYESFIWLPFLLLQIFLLSFCTNSFGLFLAFNDWLSLNILKIGEKYGLLSFLFCFQSSLEIENFKLFWLFQSFFFSLIFRASVKSKLLVNRLFWDMWKQNTSWISRISINKLYWKRFATYWFEFCWETALQAFEMINFAL